MKCPTCTQHTPDSWQPLYVMDMAGATTDGLGVEPPKGIASEVSLDYMYCANDACRELVIRVHEHYHLPPHAVEDPAMLTQTWLARPRAAQRKIDPLIREPFRTDYREAVATLDASPRMSAVLSRSLLADLLETYEGLDDFGLNDRINKFRKNEKHPSKLREGMHHFREIADFGAHTQKNEQEQIIPVTREDAEWMLDFIDRAFDYFIVTPEKDRQILAKWDQNLAEAKRKPIPPLSNGQEQES
jgi:hypothetical protein